ncbi:MAG: phosphoribosylamine--glycine ligase [Bacteroidota bacterium]
MKVLIIGSGGREHTLAWKIRQSKAIDQLFVAPGNAGTREVAQNLEIEVTDFKGIADAVSHYGIDMVIVGPEVPLVNGIHDYFLADDTLRNIPVIGPQKLGATLEGSKEFAKAFMKRHHIPTAAHQTFTAETITAGFDFLETMQPPYVLKADGLAAGKGVLIIEDLETAKKELHHMLVEAKFGAASEAVVIEEFLAGIELSCFVLTDGSDYKILPLAKDYKRIGAGDTGLNTGGMGAVSPVPFVNNAFLKQIEEKIVKPTIIGLQKDGIPYVGFIFIGLIKVGNEAKVIEYNVRMGDPETEVVIPRIKNDLLDILKATVENRLNEIDLEIDDRYATTVMTVSGGYPESYEKGKIIDGLENIKESIVFHAGTKNDAENVFTNGGRVITLTSLGKTMQEALEKSYRNASVLDFEGKYYRKDIGFDL